MAKRVLDLGNCDLDHTALRRWLETEFAVETVRCHLADEALAELRRSAADLVLVNRILDADRSPGLDFIRCLKADGELKSIPCMLVTNFAEHQAAAVAAGAEPGFGKAQIGERATRDRLARFLDAV